MPSAHPQRHRHVMQPVVVEDQQVDPPVGPIADGDRTIDHVVEGELLEVGTPRS